VPLLGLHQIVNLQLSTDAARCKNVFHSSALL
jgi:hypothetical protein